MDFSLSVIIAGTIVTVVLYASIIVYLKRLWGIKDQLTTETFLSLRAFGLALFFLELLCQLLFPKS